MRIFRPRFNIGRLLMMAIVAYITRQITQRKEQQANKVVLPTDHVHEAKPRPEHEA